MRDTPAPTAITTLRKGDLGDGVKQMQLKLIQLGYLKGTADGDLAAHAGGRQGIPAQNNLKADGVAGSHADGAVRPQPGAEMMEMRQTKCPHPMTASRRYPQRKMLYNIGTTLMVLGGLRARWALSRLYPKACRLCTA